MAKRDIQKALQNPIVQKAVGQLRILRNENKATYIQAIQAVLGAIEINADADAPQALKESAAQVAVGVVKNSDAMDVLDAFSNQVRQMTEAEQQGQIIEQQQ